MPLIFIGIAAIIFGKNEHFQMVDDLLAEIGEFIADGAETSELRLARNLGRNRPVIELDLDPVARNPLLDRHRNQLGNVAAQDRHLLADALQLQPLGLGLGRKGCDLAGPCQKRL